MALSIVRHDITKFEADAIVNSTNEHLAVGGLGVDASVHYAAGPRLRDALDKIGYCPVGSAVVTGSFGICTCKYIIHAVAPVYHGGGRNEKALLRKTYESILQLAGDFHCRSVAIPLLSAGANAYPMEEAYQIATGAIRGWLAEHDDSELEIFLVLFGADAVSLSDQTLRAYISDAYTLTHKEKLQAMYDVREYRFRRRPRRAENAPGREEESTPLSSAAPAAAREEAFPVAAHRDGMTMPVLSAAKPAQQPAYADVDLSFAEMCEWWLKKKGLKKGQFFAAANITRATFSNMKQHPDRAPKRNTVLACAIGLKLDLDQAKDLLLRAGMAFSPHYPTDRLVEQCIRSGMYNIDEINLALYEMDLMVLGYSKGE